jgi:hypothetical protein
MPKPNIAIRNIRSFTGRRAKPQLFALTLDELATKLVQWYSAKKCRDPIDVVNGVLAGELGHLRSELESPIHDDSEEHIDEYVVEAATRRIMTGAIAARLH